jgi:hypothetical protein
MVGSTLCNAIGHVAATFRSADRRSPFHRKEGSLSDGPLRTNIKDLLKAFEVQDPPTKRQKALTPEMIRDMKRLSYDWGPLEQHTRYLVEGAFFFAMRACEFTKVRKRGKTRPLTLENITFRDGRGRDISQTHPRLEEIACYMTVCFVDQKNGTRMDRWSQRTTGLAICPVRAWARICQRVRETVPGASGQPYAFRIGHEDGKIDISSERITRLLRLTNEVYGPIKGYGCESKDLGTRSICLGGAMALFLMEHSVEKIKILGRWSSDAFMVYIRPQVLEWTNIMARDMALAGNYRDLSYHDRNPRRSNRGILRGSGIIPPFYLGR